MPNSLFMYPNHSRGGVSAVLRGRAANDRSRMFYGIFDQDRRGEGIYDGLDNIETRVVRKDRQAAYLSYFYENFDLDDVSILSNPSAVEHFVDSRQLYLRYEFHSSDMKVIRKELDCLRIDRVDEFVVPSEYMAERLEALGSLHVRRRLCIVPNQVDSTVFGTSGYSDFFNAEIVDRSNNIRPLVWVGRFDKGKGYTYLLRCLSLLPADFVAYVVVSLEEDPLRAVDFISEAMTMGVSDRVRVLANLSPELLANIYRSARDLNGYLVSTSLLESFGFSVAEALACGLNVRAFDLPVWREHPMFETNGKAVDPGDVFSLAESLME